MLRRITVFDAIDQRQLMDIYQESNKENTMEFYHGRPRADAVRRTAHISSVHKNNEASLKTHEKCGFKIVSQEGFNYLFGTQNSRTYGLQYSWPPPG